VPIENKTRFRVLLVHGSWADGSCWRRLVTPLTALGYDPVAVQLPLSSFEDDLAALERCIARSPVPAILVGHSYGGAVISGIDAAAHLVEALVYVAASAPDAGETLGSLMTANPAAAAATMEVDSGGYAWAADLASFHEAFGRDLADEDAAAAFAAQKPLHVSLIDAAPATAAWRKLPSHYLVAEDDSLFSPVTQYFLAERMAAWVESVPAGHMLPLTRPEVIVDTINSAAKSIST
jgi:pimeloyl-ACP methyl ester carboxylesterase